MNPTFSLLKQRSEFLRLVRGFFEQRSFTEICSPLMVSEIGFEPHLDPLRITEEDFSGKKSERFLITSPELWMKRVLSLGCGPIFQISSCFRNKEVTSPLHTTEFTMLEWYRPHSDYHAIMDDMISLFHYLELTPPVKKTMSEVFLEHVGYDWRKLLDEHPLEKDFENAFFQVFLTSIEPKLSSVIVYDYPACMASLSTISGDVAQRFEVYYQGIELANGFNELVDPQEQRRRCESDLALRTLEGKDPLPLPEKFLSSLEHVPPSGGVALGIDRLFMVYSGHDSILRWD